LKTPTFFGYRYLPTPRSTDPATLDHNNRVDINASGAFTGIITLPDSSFVQNSLTSLPTNVIDTSNLIANSCIARGRHQKGSF
jgi:large exoprotein involved in heme utilization and adhesion